MQMKRGGAFPLNHSNGLLRKCFEGNNYYEEKLNHGRKCFIFFSGNGIFFPNDYETAETTLIKNNRYEWQNIAQNDLIRHQAGKIIFLRDVYKQWYITGINSEIDSIVKLFYFLREKTKGYEIITAGNSAGGYMAVLMGVLLSAKLVLNFSGQYVINPDKLDDGYYFIKKYQQDEIYSQFFDIRPFIEKNPAVPIMFFYPGKSDQDLQQNEFTKGIKNIFRFSFNTDKHGASMHGMDMPCVIGTEPNILQNLCGIFSGKIIDPNLFSLNLYWLRTLEYFRARAFISAHMKS